MAVALVAPGVAALAAVQAARPPSFQIARAPPIARMRATLPVPMAAISPVDRALAAGCCGGSGGDENSLETLKDGHPAPLIPSHRTIKQHGPGEMHGARAFILFAMADTVS